MSIPGNEVRLADRVKVPTYRKDRDKDGAPAIARFLLILNSLLGLAMP